MELVDRYLHAVRGYLPARLQNDVVRELAEDIHEQLGDREAELGRPLDRADVIAFLQHLGHPMVLAARFRPQQQLIGPTVFPFYWWTLGLALGVGFLVHLVLAAVSAVVEKGTQEAVQTLVHFPFTTAITVFGWVTLVFGIGDWALRRTRVLVSWDPGSLPAVPADVPRLSRVKAFAETVGAMFFLGWLLVIPAHTWAVFGPAAAFLTFGPVWYRLYPALLTLAAAQLTVPLVALVRPDLVRGRAIGKMLTALASLVIFSLLLDGGPLLVPRDGFVREDLVRSVKAIDLGVRAAIALGWVASAIDLVRTAARFYRERRAAHGASNA